MPEASEPKDSEARAIPVPLKAPIVERLFGVGEVTPPGDVVGVGDTLDVVGLDSADISSLLRY